MNKVRKIFSLLCKSLLTLLGVSVVGCESLGGDVAVMYGCPTADYTISGKVVDENKKPIKGVVISSYPEKWESGRYNLDDIVPVDFEAVTGEDGTYNMSFTGTFPPDSLYAIDIDSTLNGGEYKTTGVKLELEQAGEADDWYIGGFTASDVDFEMELKSESQSK